MQYALEAYYNCEGHLVSLKPLAKNRQTNVLSHCSVRLGSSFRCSLHLAITQHPAQLHSDLLRPLHCFALWNTELLLSGLRSRSKGRNRICIMSVSESSDCLYFEGNRTYQERDPDCSEILVCRSGVFPKTFPSHSLGPEVKGLELWS